MVTLTPQTLPARVVGRGEDGVTDHDDDQPSYLAKALVFDDINELSPDVVGHKRSRSRSGVPEPDHRPIYGGEFGVGDIPSCPTSMTARGDTFTADAHPGEGPPNKKPPSRLVQMHLDFGQSIAPKLCPSCGLLFDVCEEDQSIHRRICGALRKPTRLAMSSSKSQSSHTPLSQSTTLMFPLGHLVADVKAARSAGTSIPHHHHSSPATNRASATATTASRRPVAAKAGGGRRTISTGACDLDLLAALQPGSAKVADLSSSQTMDAIATSSVVLPSDSRTYYLFDLGTYASWAKLTEMNRPTSTTLFPYLCSLWGACTCCHHNRIMVIVRLPQSDDITDRLRKEFGNGAPLVEVVGSVRFDFNASRVHEPHLYTDLRASVRSLLHAEGEEVSKCDVHPYAYHPQDALAELQRPLCWRDEGYVRSRRLHSMGTLIPIGLYTPNTLVDITGVHFVSSAFGPKKVKRSILNMFVRADPASPPPPVSSPSADSTSVAKSVVPLFEAALGACMRVCGVSGNGAVQRASNVCTVAKGCCDVCHMYHESSEQFVSCVVECWETIETARVATELRATVLSMVVSEGVTVPEDILEQDVQAIVDRRMLECPVVSRFSPRSECAATLT